MPSNDGGLGASLVGEKISINEVQVVVNKFLGEGGFAYVFLVRDISDGTDGKNGDDGKKINKLLSKSKDKAANDVSSKGSGKTTDATASTGSAADGSDPKQLVLKVTSILSKQQREIAEKEAKLLSRLSHPSIIKVFDTCYRTIPASTGTSSAFGRKVDKSQNHKDTTQHLILMEYCEGGHAMGVCTQLRERNERFDLSTLIIAFGQICNAVSYLHAQRPPIVHRDLKPENFLIKNGAYKLCDFGSAVFGHIELKTSQARSDAEEEIQKTTTQMFRAPEMVDLYNAKKLTQATDVWALGCCLYCLAFLQNCFEEGSNLAILSRKYKIPEDNPYGEGLVELIDRMLTIDSKARADMTEVILCLSAVYSNRPLPPRKERTKKDKKDNDTEDCGKSVATSSADKERKDKKKSSSASSVATSSSARAGTFRTDGQGVHGDDTVSTDPKKSKEVRKLDPNSAAARRKLAASGGEASADFAAFDSQFEKAKVSASQSTSNINDDMAFSTTDNPFASSGDLGNKLKKISTKSGDNWNARDGAVDAALDAMSVGTTKDKRSGVERIQSIGRVRTETRSRDPARRSRSKDIRRAVRRPGKSKSDSNNGDDDDDDDDGENGGDDVDDDQSLMPSDHQQQQQQLQQQLKQQLQLQQQQQQQDDGTTGGSTIKVIRSRGVRRVASGGQGLQRSRSRSRGAGLRPASTRSSSSHRRGGGSVSGTPMGDDDDDDDDDDSDDDGHE